MPPPADAKATGGRLDGDAMQHYMESFADRFLTGRIRYGVEVQNVSRNPNGKWIVKVKNLSKLSEEVLVYDKVVLCTGVSDNPLAIMVSLLTPFFRDAVKHVSQNHYALDLLKYQVTKARSSIPRNSRQTWVSSSPGSPLMRRLLW